jgi:hypothetical protein
MSRLVISTGIVIVVVLAGCSAASAHGAAPAGGAGLGPARGKVTGRLLLEGGPLRAGGRQPGRRPVRGTVWFTAAGHRRATVQVTSSGVFSAWLVPGRYAVSGSSPRVRQAGRAGRAAPCARSVPATVQPGRVTRIAVVCIVP